MGNLIRKVQAHIKKARTPIKPKQPLFPFTDRQFGRITGLSARLDDLIQFGPIEDASFQDWRRKQNIRETLDKTLERHFPGKWEKVATEIESGRNMKWLYDLKARLAYKPGWPRGLIK